MIFASVKRGGSSIGERLRVSHHGIENRLVPIQNDHQTENMTWNNIRLAERECNVYAAAADGNDDDDD